MGTYTCTTFCQWLCSEPMKGENLSLVSYLQMSVILLFSQLLFKQASWAHSKNTVYSQQQPVEMRCPYLKETPLLSFAMNVFFPP